MRHSSLFFLIICSFTLTVTAKSEQYDYLAFVQQWPEAVCTEIGVRCKRSPDLKFTVHGIWPAKFSGEFVEHCRGSKLDTQFTLRHLLKDLHEIWPDYEQNNDEAYWRHEWKAHGRCSESKLHQYGYFSMARRVMLQSYNLLSTLQARGLAPNNQLVHRTDVEAAIKHKTGTVPAVRCNRKVARPHVSNPNQLKEIVLCFDKGGNSLIDCDQQKLGNCPDTFLFSK